MQPSLKIIGAGLRRTTEAIALQLAAPQPDRRTPDWSTLEWQLAMAAAAAHGVSPLLDGACGWQEPGWRSFLESQRQHVADRHSRIAGLLERIDVGARNRGLTIVALKGSALHALNIYRPGERPMADIDLLVRENDVAVASALLLELGFVESFNSWKHRVFKPASAHAVAGLGEHRDTQINIELHTRIKERLPVSVIDITARVYPDSPQPGVNPYPSSAALMSHLLLHTSANICTRSLRLVHLNDIARLAARMTTGDWEDLWNVRDAAAPWWALPPLSLTARYYRDAIPEWVFTRLRDQVPALLRRTSRRRTLTQASCSGLWVRPLPDLGWFISLRELGQYLRNRITPDPEAIRERADLGRTQLWVQGHSWARASRSRQFLVWLTRPVARMDTLYVVRAALAYNASNTRAV